MQFRAVAESGAAVGATNPGEIHCMLGHLSVLFDLWRWGMVNNKTWWYSARMLSPSPPTSPPP